MVVVMPVKMGSEPEDVEVMGQPGRVRDMIARFSQNGASSPSQKQTASVIGKPKLKPKPLFLHINGWYHFVVPICSFGLLAAVQYYNCYVWYNFVDLIFSGTD